MNKIDEMNVDGIMRYMCDLSDCNSNCDQCQFDYQRPEAVKEFTDKLIKINIVEE
jgi:hypothetical protein